MLYPDIAGEWEIARIPAAFDAKPEARSLTLRVWPLRNASRLFEPYCNIRTPVRGITASTFNEIGAGEPLEYLRHSTLGTKNVR